MTEQTRRTLSIAELCTISPQEAFDLIVPALLEQGRGAVDVGGGRCVYDDGRGSRCAIGLVLNEEAHQLIKNNGFNTRSFPWVAKEFSAATPLTDDRYNLIADLQGLHDDYASKYDEGDEFRQAISAELVHIASIFELNTDALFNSPYYVA